MNEFELEEMLENKFVTIDINKLAKSNIKKIIIPLHRLFDLQCMDGKKHTLKNKELFNCLKFQDIAKAKQLNKIYMTRIWNLLDDNVKKDMNFKDFVG